MSCSNLVLHLISTFAQLVDPQYIGDAMSVLPFVWTSGGSLAYVCGFKLCNHRADSSFRNIIGGTLSEPATKWPDTLGKISLLRERPYFLPCAVSGAIAFLAFSLAFIGLREVSIRLNILLILR